MRHAEDKFAFKGLVREASDRLVIQGHHAAGNNQNLFSLDRQRNAAPGPVEQRDAKKIFEPFELHLHRRLRQMQKPSRSGDVAGLGHRHKRAQRGDVQISDHRLSFSVQHHKS